MTISVKHVIISAETSSKMIITSYAACKIVETHMDSKVIQTNQIGMR
jgi:hypothetical protein